MVLRRVSASTLISPRLNRDKETMARKVTVVGAGNWGSVLGKIIAQNACRHSDLFEKTVKLWVFEELIDGRKLSEIINTTRENVKYLPGHKLPDNLLAEPDLISAVSDADVLVFVIPHQFINKVCSQMVGHVKPTAICVSTIKGLGVDENGHMRLISKMISEALHLNVGVLMGANVASEVADGRFCEATLGVDNGETGPIIKRLFETDNFLINIVSDVHAVELCGALKNIVACGAGFVDGLNYGENTKAAIIRIGLVEMTKFVQHFFPSSSLNTFFESCGVADLITSCYGGRNRKVSEAFVRTGKSMELLEAQLLGGQKLQGPETAGLVYKLLESMGLENKFPLFTAIHKICIGLLKPADMIDYVKLDRRVEKLG